MLASISIANLDPLTGLRWDDHLLYAKESGTGAIRIFNITTEAENSTISPHAPSFYGQPAMANTQLGSWIFTNGSLTGTILFYQVESNDITAYYQSLPDGEWTNMTLPIPNK